VRLDVQRHGAGAAALGRAHHWSSSSHRRSSADIGAVAYHGCDLDEHEARFADRQRGVHAAMIALASDGMLP
jgi:hypothetical protein